MSMNPIAGLIARIQGGGAPSPGIGGPPAAAAGPQGVGDDSDVKALISRMIDLGMQATQAEKDPVERAAISKIVAQLHQFAAQEQKDRDAAMGAGPAVKMIRRAQ